MRGTRRWSRLLTQNTGVDNHSIQAPDNFDQASISTKCTYSKLFKLVYDVMVENLCWEKLLSFKTAFNEKREEETLNHLDEILLIMLHALEKCKHHYTCNTPWLANYPSCSVFWILFALKFIYRSFLIILNVMTHCSYKHTHNTTVYKQCLISHSELLKLISRVVSVCNFKIDLRETQTC